MKRFQKLVQAAATTVIILTVDNGIAQTTQSLAMDQVVINSVAASQLFAKINYSKSAQIIIKVDKCNQREMQEILSILPEGISLGDPKCNNGIIYLAVTAYIFSENTPDSPNAHLKLVRINIPDIEQEKKAFETRGVKLAIDEELLRVMEDKLNLSFRDIKVKILVKNNYEDDLLVTGSDFWIEGGPYEETVNKKISTGSEINLEFSGPANAFILKHRSPASFYVTRRKRP